MEKESPNTMNLSKRVGPAHDNIDPFSHHDHPGSSPASSSSSSSTAEFSLGRPALFSQSQRNTIPDTAISSDLHGVYPPPWPAPHSSWGGARNRGLQGVNESMLLALVSNPEKDTTLTIRSSSEAEQDSEHIIPSSSLHFQLLSCSPFLPAPAATSRIELCKQWLRSSGLSISEPLNEEGIALVLVVMAGKISGEIEIEDNNSALNDTKNTGQMEGSSSRYVNWPWKVRSLHREELLRGRLVDWTLVFRYFDNPLLSFTKSESFQVLLLSFIKISQSAIPIASLTNRLWNNKKAQIEFITKASNLPKANLDYQNIELLSFSSIRFSLKSVEATSLNSISNPTNDHVADQESIDTDQYLDRHAGLVAAVGAIKTTNFDQKYLESHVPSPENSFWLCPSIYFAMLNLSNYFDSTNNFRKDILDTLFSVANEYPEYALLCFSYIRHNPFFNMESPGQAIMFELLNRLFILFTGLPSSRPTSFFIMKQLDIINPEYLVCILRVALKRARNVSDVHEIEAKLLQFNPQITSYLEEVSFVDELLSFWVVRADKNQLNLTEKVRKCLNFNKNSQILTSVTIIGFLKDHLDGLRLRPSASGGLLSNDSLFVILKEVRACPNLPAAVLEEIFSIDIYLTAFNQRNNLTTSIVAVKSKESSGKNQSKQQNQQQNHNQNQQQNQQNQQNQLQPPTFANVSRSRVSTDSNNSISTSSKSNSSNSNNTAINTSVSAAVVDDVEVLANRYFQELYVEKLSINNFISLIKSLKLSAERKDNDVFRVMIQNLFDEYRYFHKYLDKELKITALAFGFIIHNQLVSSITLGIALRYVLEALRRDPDCGIDSKKMFLFGKVALEKYRTRLFEWPQYCTHLLQIPHLQIHAPEILQDATESLADPTAPIDDSKEYSYTNTSKTSTSASASTLTSPLSFTSEAPAYSEDVMNFPNFLDRSFDLQSQLTFSSYPQNFLVTAAPATSAQTQNTAITAAGKTYFSLLLLRPEPPQLQLHEDTLEFADKKTNSYSSVIDKLLALNLPIVSSGPIDASVCDKIQQLLDSIDLVNFNSKIPVLKFLLLTNDGHFVWFADLLLKRICNHQQTNQYGFHLLYLIILDQLDIQELHKVTLNNTYSLAVSYLSSPDITSSINLRTILRNLGSFIGLATLARNKPILKRNLCLKSLLLWAYESERLITVVPFVCRILEGLADSKVFRPPNPWTLAVLGILKEIWEAPEIKMNIKFDFSVLCRSISVRIEDITHENVLGIGQIRRRSTTSPPPPPLPNSQPHSPLLISAFTAGDNSRGTGGGNSNEIRLRRTDSPPPNIMTTNGALDWFG